jgi:mRNA-degrading endonuclease RelE of RelBE toxin-antitoxin system
MSPAATPYTIRFTADAKREVESLDGSVRKQLRKILEKKLAFHPEQYGEPLAGVLKGYWSHHFAAHRIIYRMYDDVRLVLVYAVGARRAGHMSDVYRHFETLVEAGRTAQQILDVLRSSSRRKG